MPGDSFAVYSEIHHILACGLRDGDGMAMTIEELQRAIGDSPVTLPLLEAVLGSEGVHELRRIYFPRWRRSRAHAGQESLRGIKTVTVDDEFEGQVVAALAPRDVKVRIRYRQSSSDTPRTADPVSRVNLAM